MIFSLIQNKIALVTIITVGLMIVGFAAYFKWSQSELQKQASKLTSYEITIKTQEKALVQMGIDSKLIVDINKGLLDVERLGAIRERELAKTLTKLERAASGKPKLVEKLVNDAGRARNRCIEIATGAPLMKNETNRVCPQLMEKR